MSIKNSNSAHTDCKLCGSLNVKKILTACNIHGRHILNPQDNFGVFRCGDCEVTFIADVLTNPDYYAKYYPPDYYDDGIKSGLIKNLINFASSLSVKIQERRILRNFVRFRKDKLKILDIGCGSGVFLDNISDDRFDKYGIEINPQGYRICKEKRIKTYNQELKSIDFGDSTFDVITLWHVIEHIDKPYDVMATIKRILKNDGILVIATPNTSSLGFKYGQNLWFHLDAPRHLMLYNEKSLGYLVDKAGFAVVLNKNNYYDFVLDLFWSVRESLARYFIYPLYPFFKFFDRETVLLILRNK